MDDLKQQDLSRVAVIESALRDPLTRARIAAALAEHGRSSGPWWKRQQPRLAGIVSASVLLFAFLLPSIQDQWNLYRGGKVIDQYAQIGARLFEQRHYASAEKAFEKAVEMSDGRRLDLIEAQLRAHVQRVIEVPQWRGAVSEEISEGDYLYLLQLQSAHGREHDRAHTLAAFGAYLASNGRITDAEQQLRAALELDPSNSDAHINLGNLFDDRGDAQSAEREYRRAIELDHDEPSAYYNLGTLLLTAGRAKEAEVSLRQYIALEPDEAEGYVQLAESLAAQGRNLEAGQIRQQGSRTAAVTAHAPVTNPPP